MNIHVKFVIHTVIHVFMECLTLHVLYIKIQPWCKTNTQTNVQNEHDTTHARTQTHIPQHTHARTHTPIYATQYF